MYGSQSHSMKQQRKYFIIEESSREEKTERFQVAEI
jgi:hypothetical protein